MPPMSTRRRITSGVLRGLGGKCPNCGEGRLFWRYLKVQPACEGCAHDLAQYPADDGPAYVTILVLGHLVVAPLLLFPFIWEAPVALVLPITLIPLALVTLGVLPVIKGGFIGLLWALRVRQADAALHTADVLE
jgi:uncharacterized protein (DUF983 family)